MTSIGPNISLCVVVDFKPAMTVATSSSVPLDRSRLALDIQLALERLTAAGCIVSFAWVPSHGKEVSDWIPDSRFTEAELRAINDTADTAATRALDSARFTPCRVSWVAAQLRAQHWTESVFRLIADSAEQYKNFLERRWEFNDTDAMV